MHASDCWHAFFARVVMYIAIFFIVLAVVVFIYAFRVSRKTKRKDFMDKSTDEEGEEPPTHSRLR